MAKRPATHGLSKIAQSFSSAVVNKRTPRGLTMIPGIFSWALNIQLGKKLGATPNGRHAGDPFHTARAQTQDSEEMEQRPLWPWLLQKSSAAMEIRRLCRSISIHLFRTHLRALTKLQHSFVATSIWGERKSISTSSISNR